MLSADQKSLRQQGIGSSEIAAVAGISPWSGPLEVWARKTGSHEDEESHHLERGIYLEPGLIDWYAARVSRKVSIPGTLVYIPSKIVIATPDGISRDPLGIEENDRVLEIKAPGWRTYHHWGEPGTDQIPEYYIPQVIWECAVTGLGSADVAVFLDGDLKIFRVPFNEQLFDALRHRAEAFWRDYVVPRCEPPADASDKAKQWLARRYPKATHDLLEATAETEAIAGRLREAKALKKKATEQEALAKHQLQQAIGIHEGIVGPDWRVSWRNNKDRESIDYEQLVSDLKLPPETIERYRTVKPGPRIFRTTFR